MAGGALALDRVGFRLFHVRSQMIFHPPSLQIEPRDLKDFGDSSRADIYL